MKYLFVCIYCICVWIREINLQYSNLFCRNFFKDRLEQLSLEVCSLKTELEIKNKAFQVIRDSEGNESIPSLLGQIADLEIQLEQTRKKQKRQETQVCIAQDNVKQTEVIYITEFVA